MAEKEVKDHIPLTGKLENTIHHVNKTVMLSNRGISEIINCKFIFSNGGQLTINQCKITNCVCLNF